MRSLREEGNTTISFSVREYSEKKKYFKGSFQYYLQLIAVNSCLNEDILWNYFELQVNKHISS